MKSLSLYLVLSNEWFFFSSYVLAGSNCVEKERDSVVEAERERGCRVLAEK